MRFSLLLIFTNLFYCDMAENSMTSLTACNNEIEFDSYFKPSSFDLLYKTYNTHPKYQPTLDELFKIKEKIGNKTKKKLVAYSLFFKPQEVVNLETIHQERAWKDKHCSFFDKYCQPLLDSIDYFQKHEKDTTVRIYLAEDLEVLIPSFKGENVQIYLMNTSSIGHSPGAMWRFLSLNDPDADFISIKDSDDRIKAQDEMLINKWFNDPSTKGFYRYGSYKISSTLELKDYSPIQAGLFGAKAQRNLDIEKLLKGFILYRDLYKNEKRHPRDVALDGHPYGFGNIMPVYGFDERFLKHVIYFYAAQKGELYSLTRNQKEKKVLVSEVQKSSSNFTIADYRFILKYNKQPFYE